MSEATLRLQIPGLDQLVRSIDQIVCDESGEAAITQAVAGVLKDSLAGDLDIPPSLTQPGKDHYVMYPLHVDPEGRFCIASAVWGPGQITPVHGHETWGVVGIYSGAERETRFEPSHDDHPGLRATQTEDWGQEQ